MLFEQCKQAALGVELINQLVTLFKHLPTDQFLDVLLLNDRALFKCPNALILHKNKVHKVFLSLDEHVRSRLELALAVLYELSAKLKQAFVDVFQRENEPRTRCQRRYFCSSVSQLGQELLDEGKLIDEV